MSAAIATAAPTAASARRLRPGRVDRRQPDRRRGAVALRDWLAPFDPLRSNVRMRLRPPDALHWFGTDHFGRDMLCRADCGPRISIVIGLCTAAATGLFGTLIGAASGFSACSITR